ncbi:SUMF1/EgtB/PvdO family nonheme iron enzyme [Halomonas sp. DN3]|uniref:formylglycine-generating enzyme family protein n=1 Tax=Halomonas sp. DN3 TaxID=2953657 RepID=UPI0020A2231D|nr:SUMF1/EgtB/PvdO family nonheme iron enzyme [Halomonas sp. DN3]USZ50114.1 formylglycine-generating enzyme family protein [Halomonas sp. DN3]
MEGIYRFGAFVVIGLTLAGCDDVSSQAMNGTDSSGQDNEPPNQEAVAALVQKTMDNLVFVEGGSFQMGDFGPIDPKAGGLPYSPYSDNKPLHEVTLDSYSISAYQVSYADFDIYTEATGQPRINTEGFEVEYRAPDVPAGVDWYQARDYCQWLADQTGLPFALPTEAQWEYAARSRGQFLPLATNDGYIRRGENYPSREEIIASTPSPHVGPQTIGLIPPNPLGVYQMGLNGFEWVNDWYSEDYYDVSPEVNPTGP